MSAVAVGWGNPRGLPHRLWRYSALAEKSREPAELKRPGTAPRRDGVGPTLCSTTAKSLPVEEQSTKNRLLNRTTCTKAWRVRSVSAESATTPV